MGMIWSPQFGRMANHYEIIAGLLRIEVYGYYFISLNEPIHQKFDA